MLFAVIVKTVPSFL